MARFFIDKSSIRENTIILTGKDVNHIKNVLRYGPGDTFVVCDGECTDYEVAVEEIGTGAVRTVIIKQIENKNEPPVKVTLFQAVPKSDKMDTIVQKCVELGINKIVPVITHRTVVKFNSGKDAAKKVCRWQKIAMEASKQSNRGIIPRVEKPAMLKDVLRLSNRYHLFFMPYENERDNNIKSFTSKSELKDIGIFIGPEGGFTYDEAKACRDCGIITITLGPRILRTETAGFSLLSILMYQFGDMG